MTDSLKCPTCRNYRDTPGHELGCPETFVGGVPHGLNRDGSGLFPLPPIPVTPGSVSVPCVEPPHVHEWIVEACGCGAVRDHVTPPPSEPPPITAVDYAIAEWEVHGPTSLTTALMADALYGAQAELAELKAELALFKQEYRAETIHSDPEAPCDVCDHLMTEDALDRAEEAETQRDELRAAMADVTRLADELHESPLWLRREAGKRLKAILAADYSKDDEDDVLIELPPEGSEEFRQLQLAAIRSERDDMKTDIATVLAIVEKWRE